MLLLAFVLVESTFLNRLEIVEDELLVALLETGSRERVVGCVDTSHARHGRGTSTLSTVTLGRTTVREPRRVLVRRSRRVSVAEH